MEGGGRLDSKGRCVQGSRCARMRCVLDKVGGES